MKKSVLFAVLILLVLVISGNAFYTVEENQYACTFRFSEIVDTKGEAGLYFKIPFIDQVKYFSKATQLYDIPPSEVLTSDKQNMTVDCYILWKIDDPQQFYRALGTPEKAEERLDAITYNTLKTAMGTLAQADIINMEDGALRNEIYESIATIVDGQAKTYGIQVEDVKIKQFDLPDSNLNAVYTRMISERNQMAEKYTAEGNKEANLIRNEVDKDVNILISNAQVAAAKRIAEGEAEYMRILATAYDTEEERAFYEFTLALEALRASLNGDEKTIVLDENSELGKILMGILN
jgi:membrane protease subunit HflC